MVGVRERPAAADGDEAGVAVFGEDHGCTFLVASAQRQVKRRWRGGTNDDVANACATAPTSA
jgi:hypothetical protein